MYKKILFIAMLTALVPSFLWCGKDSEKKEKSMVIVVGNQAPDFTLPDENGVEQTLSAQRGKKMVIYFYPKDGTPGCTKEACSLRDGYGLLQQAGITIWGISYDSPKSHKAFKAKHHLPFTLLSDSTKEVAKLYGVKGWFFVDRVTFLIDEKGVVVQRLDDVDVSAHAQQIVDAFKAAGKEK